MKTKYSIRLYVLLLITWLAASPLQSAPLMDIETTDIHNTRHSLGDKKSKVLVFLGQECAISRRYIPRLNELSSFAKELGLDFYGIFSDSWSTKQKALLFQQEYQVSFPLIMDSSETIAKSLEPTAKPEAFVLTADGRIAYQGRIDDRFADLGRLRQAFDQHDLLNAISAVSKGSTPKVTRTKTIGCFYGGWD